MEISPAEQNDRKKLLWKLNPEKRELRKMSGSQEGKEILVEIMSLEDQKGKTCGELDYSTWSNGPVKYLYIWWLEVDESYQNKVSVVRDFLTKFVEIIQKENIEKIRWQSDNAAYLDHLYGGHEFAERVIDNKFPMSQLDIETKKGTKPESFYEASAADILKLASRLTK